jgi:hypothetical protein
MTLPLDLAEVEFLIRTRQRQPLDLTANRANSVNLLTDPICSTQIEVFLSRFVASICTASIAVQNNCQMDKCVEALWRCSGMAFGVMRFCLRTRGVACARPISKR